MQGSPEPKKPCKGILKTSSSFDRHSGSGASYRKSAKFDELNVMQTYHPPDKDYGHMKIEEPKTPYNYAETDDTVDHLDAELLAEKLRMAASTRTSSYDDDDDDSSDEIQETAEEKARRLEFEKRRKAHYNEYEAVKLARKLIEEEDDDEDDGGNAADGNAGENKSKQTEADDKIRNTTENTNSSDKEMDIDAPDDIHQGAEFPNH